MSAPARLRRGLFELLYKNRALYWFASTVPFAGQWRVWQRLALPRLHGPEVLEVGCGLGDLLVEMVQAGYRCQAIDRSPQMVAAARAKLARHGLVEQVKVVEGSVQRLPFGDASFASVVSTFPTDYIADPAAVREIARVLRPGGRVIIVVGANLLPIGPMSFALTLLHALVYGPGARPARRPAHLPDQTNPDKPATDQPNDQTASQPNERSFAAAGPRIPLEEVGLRRTEERVVSRAWEALVVLGEKAE